MTPTNSRLRVLVDWDNDGFVNRDAKTTDPLNLISTPLTMRGLLDSYPFAPRYVWHYGGAEVTYKYAPTKRGLFAMCVTMPNTNELLIGNKGVPGDAVNPIYWVNQYQPAKTFTVQFYVRAIAGYSGTLFTVNASNGESYTFSTSGITQTPTTFVPTASWQLVTHTFTTDATGIGGFNLSLHIKHTSGVGSTELQITGMALFEGTYITEQPFNVGTELSLHDNLENDQLSITWQLGMGSIYDTVASEGILNVQLDNSNKQYSMEYSGSFLYQAPGQVKFGQLSLVIVEMYDEVDATWYELWRGFIDKLEVNTGVVGVTASLMATQGIFKFENTSVNTGILQNKTADQIIKKLIEQGWVTAVIPNQAVTDKTAIQDTLTYAVVSDTGTYELDTGINVYDFSGETWQSGSTSPNDIVRELMVAEQGLFFLDRSGKIRFMHRDKIYTEEPTAPASITLTASDVLTSTYLSDQARINSVKFDYYPKTTLVGQIWASKTPVVVGPNELKVFTAKFEYTEGTKVTVLSINPFSGSTPSTATAANVIGQSIASSNFTISTLLKNGEAEITIQNNLAVDMYLTIVLNGSILISYGATSVYRTDTQSKLGRGSSQVNYSSKLVTTEAQASDIAEYIIACFSKRFSTFTGFTLGSRDAAWQHRMSQITIGKRIIFSEDTTGGVTHRHMVVGESGSWTPGYMSINYMTRPADNFSFAVYDVTNFNGGVY